MPQADLYKVMRTLRQIVGGPATRDVSDGELLARFVATGDQAAFELLLWRHGAMVNRLCLDVTRNQHQAEDAFQATFLAFVRSATTIRTRDSVGAWLHQTAYRAARRIRRQSLRTGARIDDDQDLADVDARPGRVDSLVEREMRLLVHAEVLLLAPKYRAPVILCYLEGATHVEAARKLGWPIGTVAGRLARARGLLRTRLTRRGIALPAALSALAARSADVRAAVIEMTMRNCALVSAGSPTAAIVSPAVSALTGGVLQEMFFTRVFFATAMTLLLGLAGGGVVLWASTKAIAPGNGAQENSRSLQNGVAAKVTLDLVGVTHNTLKRHEQVWWKPDGAVLPSPPYFYPYAYSNEQVPYEFAFRVRDEDDFNYTFEGPVHKGSPVSTVPQDEAQKSLANLRAVVIGRFSETDRTATLRVGVATGAWVKVDEWLGYPWEEMSGAITSAAPVVFKWPRQDRDGAFAEITHTYVDDATRLVAFDRQGKPHVSLGAAGGSGKGLVQLNCSFPGLKLRDIQRFEFQKRPYDTWITLTNISLQPGYRTDPRTKRGDRR